MKVLVLGGTGFVGRNLYEVQPEWEYWGSSQCDLLDYQETLSWIKELAPDAIINLAGFVGGIKTNTHHNDVLLEKNTRINLNTLRAADEAGVERVLTSLSTCMWPDRLATFSEGDWAFGEPPPSNSGYAWAKRIAHEYSVLLSTKPNRTYTTFAPSNLYGPHDNFGESGHFVAALIRKVYEARAAGDDFIELWGTGRPYRQQLYVKDLARVIPRLLAQHLDPEPLLIGPPLDFTIAFMAETLIDYAYPGLEVRYTGKYDGQHKKFGHPGRFQRRFHLVFTPFRQGVKKTFNWYANQRDSGLI